MTLKSLIQWLLDSRTTPSEASHSSYPDDGTVTQFSPSATSVSSWTKVVDSTIAPSDGYVIVRGKATGESFIQITAGDNPPHMERSTFAKATLNQYSILNLPIAKGKTFKVFAENTAEITVGLIKSIGGGITALISYQSNPTVQATHITPSATGEWVSIVSPCNGWFCVKGVASQVLLSNGEVWQGCHTTEASYKGFCLPVSKGWSVAYILSTNATSAYVFFVPSIGNK